MDLHVPPLGEAADVTVIEVHVQVGDHLSTDDPVVTLETDKATMDVPATAAGVIEKIHVSTGDRVSAGDPLLSLAAPAAGTREADTPIPGGPAAAVADAPAHQAGYGSASGVYRTVDEGPSTATGTTATLPAPATGSESVPADRHAQVLVLGAGPGGYTAAFRAADLGQDVVLVDRSERLGGVCLNVGCIPSKALLHAAKVIADARDMAGHGIRFASPDVDINRLRDWKNHVVRRLTGGLAALARQRAVTVLRGEGRFLSPTRLQVTGPDGTSTTVSFDHAIIAAGSEPVRLPFVPHDDPRVLDSTGALDLTDIPGRLLILGGGIIGLEMATVYAELGSRITVVELMDQLIPGADAQLIAPLAKRLRTRYDNIYLRTKVTAVEATEAGLTVSFDGPDVPATDTFDKILVAVGRRPNGGAIGAEHAGVTVDERGFIPVGTQMRTDVPHIFAIGDVVGQPMLAHKAVHEARVAAEAAAGQPSSFDARAIPSVAYTDPEVAWAGVTESQAQQAGINYGVGHFPWAASGRSLSLGRDEGLTRLIIDQDSHRVIGCGIVGPSAGELIAETVLAIELGADAADLALTVHPHPTLSETVGMAAEVFEGTITDLYLPASKPARQGT